MDKIGIAIIILVFLLGWFSNDVFSYISFEKEEIPYFSLNAERASPKDRIKESQIQIFKDHILINVRNTFLASYANTNSMDPVLDEGANGLEIVPESPTDIQVGDIIAYNSNLVNGLVAHRVVKIGYDDAGSYFIVQGDNNPNPDPDKVRFDQIQYILIGVIY